MDKKEKIKVQIEEFRAILNKKLLNNIIDEEMGNLDTLNASCKLDELIVEYMNIKEKE